MHGNGPADNQVTGTGFQRTPRGQNPLLIIGGGPRRADSRRYYQEFFPAIISDDARFPGRSDHPVEAVFLAQQRQTQHMFLQGFFHFQLFFQRFFVKRCQNSNSKRQWPWYSQPDSSLRRSFHRSTDHGAAAA